MSEELDNQIMVESNYEEEEKEGKKELSNSELTKLDNFSSVNEMLSFAKVLCSSGLTPTGLKTPEKVVVAIQMGRELGFNSITSLNNIHVIEGKPTLSVHAFGALLSMHNVEWKTIKDFEPEYKTDEATGEVIYYKIDNKGKFVVENNIAVRSSKEEGGKPKIIDKVTTIRYYKVWNGIVIEEDVSFRMSDAEKQGLLTKSNWIKMPKIMLWNRTQVLGARRVKPKAFIGMYEISEIAEIHNKNIDLDEFGNPTINL